MRLPATPPEGAGPQRVRGRPVRWKPSLDDPLRATGPCDAARAAYVARQPIGRIARPEEIAALVVYLAGDESSHITGVVHMVDGGRSNP